MTRLRIYRQSAEIQVTRPSFRHPAGVERAARAQQVPDCSGSYGGRQVDDDLASILLSKAYRSARRRRCHSGQNGALRC